MFRVRRGVVHLRPTISLPHAFCIWTSVANSGNRRVGSPDGFVNLNRLAQPMRDLDLLPDAAGVTQFDLPLAPLVPGEYYLQFSVAGPAGSVDQRIGFRITG
jgi:hypothetical protein